jgi:AAA+ superfamily predicted ATPase
MSTDEEEGWRRAAEADQDPPGIELQPLRAWVHAEALPAAAAGALRGLRAVVAAAREAGVVAEFQHLPFFARETWMVRFLAPGAPAAEAAYGLWSAAGLFPMDGTSAPVHDANAREGLALSDAKVLLYAAWFCRHVHGDDGPFWPVAHPDDLNDGGPRDASADAPSPGRLIEPPSVARRPGDAGWTVQMCVQYGDALFRATFTVDTAGLIEMAGDEPLAAGIPYDRALNARPPDWSVTEGGLSFAAHASPAPRHPSQRAVARSVGEALVRQQLLRALRAGAAAPLFVPTAADDEGLLAEFARFVLDSAALVVIESRMDYVERIVGDLVVARAGRPVLVERAAFTTVPEPGVKLPEVHDRSLVLVSLHEGGRLLRPQAVAFVLGSTDAAALVGCRGRADLAEPLRQIVDVTLALPPVDAAAFRELFCEVLDCPWPAGRDFGAAAWLPYLEPADLQRALRDRAFRDGAAAGASGWRPEDGLAAVEARATERLARFLPDEPRRLADLAGLGEARQVVQDLLADFMDALAGRVEWREVDRGMLLVGPPGTGKTMLARVLAQECGMRFVSASIAGWMTGDASLGAVIEAMRQTFTDARQYAPCILFLDEIDSLGNRQKFGGHNLGWDTGFLTAVLAEMQGFDETRGVFVIGATNHEDQVDPALRRAGRLDQVVRLDYPPVEDLARILDGYLAPYRAAGRLAAGVDVAAIGGVMAGRSGAEVEQLVRDAARRARRDGGPIAARHLLAAATGAPRRPATGAAVTPAELERTAFHEAGHAVAQLTAQLVEAEIAVVSIVPRSDGSLGYVGFLPREATGWTAAHYREHIEAALAGRAAEELRYGAESVTGGAGGPGEGCDLARATATAAYLACAAGLGEPRRLAWRPQPTGPADVAAIRATLESANTAVLARLRSHWPLVEALAQALLGSRQMLGVEVRALARTHGVAARGGSATARAGSAP